VDRRSVLRAAVATGAVALGGGVLGGAAPTWAGSVKRGGSSRDITYRRWTSAADFATGTAAGTSVSGDALVIGAPSGQLTYTDPFKGTTGTYDYAVWTSPRVGLSYPATEAVASWNADTPGGTWVQLEMRGVTQLGNTTKWYVLGRWAADDTYLARTSVPSQGDTDGSVSIDTFVAATGHGWTAWDLRVTLLRPAGTTQTPTLRSVGAMASTLPASGKVTASTPQNAQGVVIDVPRYSQQIHSGQYPQWDNGGEAWCSPTSTSMVVSYWGTGPTPTDYAWVDPSYADPWVDYAARNTFDHNYSGCGNWPFNAAYAGRYGLDAFITRLRSMNEAERFIAAGIPLVVSGSWKNGQVGGLSYGTNGHLMVLVGFTATGELVINDPNSPTDADVRKVVSRADYEAAWLNSSGGIVYVIHPSSVPLPTAPTQANW